MRLFCFGGFVLGFYLLKKNQSIMEKKLFIRPRNRKNTE